MTGSSQRFGASLGTGGHRPSEAQLLLDQDQRRPAGGIVAADDQDLRQRAGIAVQLPRAPESASSSVVRVPEERSDPCEPARWGLAESLSVLAIVALLGRTPEPLRCLGIVLGYAPPLGEHHAELNLSQLAAPLGG